MDYVKLLYFFNLNNHININLLMFFELRTFLYVNALVRSSYKIRKNYIITIIVITM